MIITGYRESRAYMKAKRIKIRQPKPNNFGKLKVLPVFAGKAIGTSIALKGISGVRL